MPYTYATTPDTDGHIRPHHPRALDIDPGTLHHPDTPTRTDRAHPDTGTRHPSAPPCLHLPNGGGAPLWRRFCEPAGGRVRKTPMADTMGVTFIRALEAYHGCMPSGGRLASDTRPANAANRRHCHGPSPVTCGRGSEPQPLNRPRRRSWHKRAGRHDAGSDGSLPALRGYPAAGVPIPRPCDRRPGSAERISHIALITTRASSL